MADSEPSPYYLALDPGLKTGWAYWDKNGTLLAMGTTRDYDDLHKHLASLPDSIRVVILEDFKLFRNKAIQQTGSRMPAPKAIGQIETFARLWKAQIVKQPSNIKPTAEDWTGKRTKDYATGRLLMPKEQTHVWDAYNHGEYYLIKNNIKKIDLSEFGLNL
jgi:hypothetical protein